MESWSSSQGSDDLGWASRVVPGGRWASGLQDGPFSFASPSRMGSWVQNPGWGECESKKDPCPDRDTGLEPAEALSVCILQTRRDCSHEKSYYDGEMGLIPLESKSMMRERPVCLHTAGPR